MSKKESQVEDSLDGPILKCPLICNNDWIPHSFLMKKASFCLLSLLLICAVFAEWDPVECTNKDVLKAIDVVISWTM